MPPYQRRLVEDRLGELDTVSSPGIVALIGDCSFEGFERPRNQFKDGANDVSSLRGPLH